MAEFRAREMEMLLGIRTATLRKYASKLESNGYKFVKNRSGHRLYAVNDLEILRNFIALKKEEGLSLDKSAKRILQLEGLSDVADIATNNNSKNHVENQHFTTTIAKVEQLSMQQSKQLETQNQQLEALRGMLDAQMKYSQETNRTMEALSGVVYDLTQELDKLKNGKFIMQFNANYN